LGSGAIWDAHRDLGTTSGGIGDAEFLGIAVELEEAVANVGKADAAAEYDAGIGRPEPRAGV
jgi:hypothetical protein